MMFKKANQKNLRRNAFAGELRRSRVLKFLGWVNRGFERTFFGRWAGRLEEASHPSLFFVFLLL